MKMTVATLWWFLSLVLTSGVVSAQCGPYEPAQDQLSTDFEDAIIDAVLMLTCCAQCTQDDDMQDVADGLLEKWEDGLLRQEEGDDSWGAFTAPDVQCGDVLGWTSDPGNAIVMNTRVFSEYSDPVATAAVLAGMLAHEYMHCLTFQNSRSESTGAWADICNLWEDEMACYSHEIAVLQCLQTCGCVVGITGGGTISLDERLVNLGDFHQSYSDLYNGGC